MGRLGPSNVLGRSVLEYTATEAITNAALDVAFGGMGYQMLKGGGKLAVHVVGEEVAKRAGVLTEEQVVRGAAERAVEL